MRQYKKNDPLSYALGMTLTFELIKYHPEQIRDVYFHSKLRENEHTDRLVKTLSTLGISIQVQDKIFNVLSPKNNCFVIASFAKYETTLDVTASHLVLVEPENAGNLGTIIRTALGFGICNMVLIGNHVDPFDPKTIRASMGAIFGVHCTSFDTFSNYQAHALNHHYYPFMLQSNHLLGNEPIQAPYSLIFGPESKGLDASYLSIGTPLRIAHTHAIDSLNLTNATSIALYEATRLHYLKAEGIHE